MVPQKEMELSQMGFYVTTLDAFMLLFKLVFLIIHFKVIEQ